ncbi:MAG: ABC transporter ATP-binding protein [Oscillospiraceae bacterium]|jgi:ABC-2 type transport system ATP-binding protein|nr:ABC transporter ATP-binding protein [Oscillospiraceae bacterium]
MQVLSIDSVIKIIDKGIIIDDLSLGVEEGEILGLIGPNGAGKSTVIHMVGGLVMPNTGDIRIAGVSMYDDFERCMSYTGVVLDKPEFYKNMTGYQNLQAIAAVRPKIGRKEIDRAVGMLELDDYIDKRVSAYPTGEIKRLAIAAAVMHSPRLLLLDEAIDGMDPIAFLHLRKVIKKMTKSQGTAVVMTSHHMSDLERICDRVAVLEDGVLIGTSSVAHLKKFGTGKTAQRMLIDQPEAAARHIFEALHIPAEIRSGYVIFECEKSLVPKITSILFTSGYRVYEAKDYEISLEEAYYRLLRERPMDNDDEIDDRFGAYEGDFDD